MPTNAAQTSPRQSTAATEAPPTIGVEKSSRAAEASASPAAITSTPRLANCAASVLKARLSAGRPPISRALSGAKTAVPAAGWSVRATAVAAGQHDPADGAGAGRERPGGGRRSWSWAGRGRRPRAAARPATRALERRRPPGPRGSFLDRRHELDRRRQAEAVGREDVAVRHGADQVVGVGLGSLGVADEERAAAHALGQAAEIQDGRVVDLEEDERRAVFGVLAVGDRQDLDRDGRDRRLLAGRCRSSRRDRRRRRS